MPRRYTATVNLRCEPGQLGRLGHLAARLELRESDVIRAFLDGVSAIDGVELTPTLLKLRMAEPHYEQVAIEREPAVSLRTVDEEVQA
jgi:hypothetical protein